MKTRKKSKFKSAKFNIPTVDVKTKKEVDRILKQNMRCNVGESSNMFARHFITNLLKEQEDA